MSCSELDEATLMTLYYWLKPTSDQELNTYSAIKFVESVERRDPQLVAVTLAKIRLEII